MDNENIKVEQETINTANTAYGLFNREVIERFSRDRNEPPWMLAKRLRAWTIYCEMPGQVGNMALPPSRRLDIRELRIQDFSGPLLENTESIRNAAFSDLFHQGVIFTTLSEALHNYTELVEKYFMTECVRLNDSKFTALHAAFWNTGSFLYVPKNMKIDVPIENNIFTGSREDILFPHTLIIVEEGASVTFIETSHSDIEDKQAFVDGVVEIIAGPGATVNYISTQLLGNNTYHFAFKKATAKKDSTVNWYEIGIGSKISQSNIQLILDESGAAGEMLGVYFPRDHQQMEYNTLQVHASPHTKSNLLYKGALQEKAKTVFNGIIQVHKGAQRTDAYQANKNILLSSDAHADSIPTLEIEANDVRCTHGVTVGPIDEEVLYYLMSRGLKRDEATRMLVVGFLVPVIDKIPVEKTREEVREHIESRIG
ncbi:MAG: Fe-S cluster assembly protein SufD [Bacteroidota bacterium]